MLHDARLCVQDGIHILRAQVRTVTCTGEERESTLDARDVAQKADRRSGYENIDRGRLGLV